MVHGSLADLLEGCTDDGGLSRIDSLSGATFTKVTRDGQPYVVKHLSRESDWVMRATGDEVFRPVAMWSSGLYAQLPACLDSCVVGAARFDGGAAVLMRDISPWLLPEGAAAFTPEVHAQVLEHMAALHATFWGWQDDVGLCTPGQRLTFLSLRTAELEQDGADAVPKALPGGWAALEQAAPEAGALARRLADGITPLTDALARLPQTLVHGDWKGGNLGQLPHRRTALVDWAFPGQDVCLADLGWYLAVNCDRLPESKERSIDRYRAALEAQGIATEGWWEEALALCLLGAFVQMGWSKSGDELAWWADRALAAAPRLS